MKIKKSHWLLIVLAFFSFLWSYSFSTRIGLFFVVPLWLKIIVIITLTVNFWLLGFQLILWVNQKIERKAIRNWAMVGSIVLSGVIFLFLPYERVPFRTTHHLEITALETDVQLKAILSPDDNLIKREEFEISGGVEEYYQTGFRIHDGAYIKYQRPFIGKLSLLFTVDSGPARIYWDGTVKTFDPSLSKESGHTIHGGWQIYYTEDANEVEVRLPGNNWGQPDLFWAFLGTLLPISDFITLTSTLTLLIIFCFQRVKPKIKDQLKFELLKLWVDFLISITLIIVLLRVGFPEFLPCWFLLIFIPTNLYLSYSQIDLLQRNSYLNLEIFSELSKFIRDSRERISQSNKKLWVFWISMVIIGLVGSVIQLSMTSPGMIVSGDSIHYLEGARNLAEGHGYVINFIANGPIAITGFDPGYSISLVPGILMGLDAQVTARLLNALLLFLTVILIGYIIYQIVGKVFPAVIAGLFVIMSTVTVSIFSFVMSEPLFIVLLLTTMYCWYIQIKKPSIINTFLAGLICTLMLIVRLAGIVFLPVLALGILVYEELNIKHRISHAFIFGFTSMIAPILFFLRNKSITNTSGRTQGQGFVPFPQESWEVIGKEFSSWFKWHAYFNYDHQRFNAVIITFGFILVLFTIWLLFRSKLKSKYLSDKLIVLLLFSSLLYFLSIIINSMTSVPTPTTSGIVRYMIPLFYLLLIIVVVLFSFYWKQPYLFPKMIILFILLVGMQLYHTELLDLLIKTPIVYRHYTDRKNECGDDVIRIIDQLPNINYYSNRCEYFYFVTGRQCKHLDFDQSAYSQDGEISQAIETGEIIAFTQGFGSNPPGIFSFLTTLEQFDRACYISFYRWKD